MTAAARVARRAQMESRDDQAPFGFSARVVARWRGIRDEERRLALWQRVSWRAAAVSLGLCAVVALVARGGGAERPLIEPPALVIPSL